MINVLRSFAIAAIALLAACNIATPPDPGKAESYSVRLAVTPAEGGSEQRIALPASALVAFQSADRADLRLFDASGRNLPLAPVGAAAIEQQAGFSVPTYPVIGSSAPGTSGVALTIGADNVARVVGMTAPAGPEQTVAALFDTRQLADPAIALTLDADLPLHQPVAITLESSADLREWVPRGDKVLFRTDADGAQLETGRINLPGVSLKGQYLRASWGGTKGVAVRGARVTTAKSGAPELVVVKAGGGQLIEPREVRFALPFRGPLAGIRIDPLGGEGAIPVELAARGNPELAWTPLAAATLRRPGWEGNVMELSGPAQRDYRVVADPRSAGFAKPPEISLYFEPVELVAQFNGKPPYTLAVGLSDAPSTLLSFADVVPGGVSIVLPRAEIAGGPQPLVSLAGAEPESPLSGKRAILWLALLAGTAVLGFSVMRLMKGNASKGEDSA